MAERILRILDPVTGTKQSPENPFSESFPTTLLATVLTQFHFYTRYENTIFNYCNHCQGNLIVPLTFSMLGGMLPARAYSLRVIIWELRFF